MSNYYKYTITAVIEKECPECYGGGIIPTLYPTGHHEVKCEICEGRGYIEDLDSPLIEKIKEHKCDCGGEKTGLPHYPWCSLETK